MACEILEAARVAKNDPSLTCLKECMQEGLCRFADANSAEQVFPRTQLPALTENVFVQQNLQEEKSE